MRDIATAQPASIILDSEIPVNEDEAQSLESSETNRLAIMGSMPMVLRTAGSFILCLSILIVPLSLSAQNAPPAISPELAHRIESALRSQVELPPASSISFGARTTGEIPGYDRLQVHYSSSETGASGDIPLLVSKDGTHIAQFTAFDISADPRLKFPADDRPARGGPANAPVTIVGYDDLECPFCARLHAELFPAVTDRYKDQVRVVYQSYPAEGHPWAMRAAVDTDCLGDESAPAYWAAVDHIHAHASDYGGAEHSLAKAQQELDTTVIDQGHAFGVNEAELKACIVRQDTTKINASVRTGTSLGVIRTPTIFINDLKIEGAVPASFVFEMIDNALKAEGKTPPPPVQEKQSAAPHSPDAPSTATKSENPQ
jgi:protein-disulfide isomerase